VIETANQPCVAADSLGMPLTIRIDDLDGLRSQVQHEQ
jgi:hypothetical protein